eukprot:gene5978-6581_t
MGVKKLLTHLKSITVQFYAKELANQVVGVDAKSWLHRAIRTSRESCLGQVTSSFQDYLLAWIKLLKSSEIMDAIFVFDGCDCLVKEEERSRRSQLQQYYSLLAIEAEAEDDQNKADIYYKRAATISFDQIQYFMYLLREHNLPYLVAPYEADAQLAYLSNTGDVDIVISEDSDLLVYGCQRVLYKLGLNGIGELIDRNDLCRNSQLSFEGWTDLQFMIFCCLSGCDYVPSLPGVGIKTAHQIVSRNESVEGVFRSIRSRESFNEAYFNQLLRAIWTYQHHLVYNPVTKQIEHLYPIPKEGEWIVVKCEECMGITFTTEELHGLVTGKLNPKMLRNSSNTMVMQPICKEDPPLSNCGDDNIWAFQVERAVCEGTNKSVRQGRLNKGNRSSKRKWITSSDKNEISAAIDKKETQYISSKKGNILRSSWQPLMASTYQSPHLSSRFAKIRHDYNHHPSSVTLDLGLIPMIEPEKLFEPPNPQPPSSSLFFDTNRNGSTFNIEYEPLSADFILAQDEKDGGDGDDEDALAPCNLHWESEHVDQWEPSWSIQREIKRFEFHKQMRISQLFSKT